MISAQQQKYVNVTPPAAIIDNAAATTAAVDTNGWDYCQFLVIFGAMDIAVSVMKMRESDDDSTYADVTGLVWGTSNNIAGSTSTVPSSTDDNKIFVFDIDLRGRKRYMDLSLTLGDGATGTYVTVIAILSRAKDGPVTAAERGAAEILRVPNN